MKRKRIKIFIFALILAAGCGNNLGIKQDHSAGTESTQKMGADKNMRMKIDEWAKKLYEKDPEIRSSAAASLLSSDDPRALEALLRVLRKEETFLFLDILAKEDKDNARISVIKAFGVKEDDRALELIIAALEDKNPDVRQAAVDALGHLKSVKAIKRMAQILKSGDAPPRTRQLIVEALGETRSRLAVESLISVLNSENPKICESAQKSLEKIANQSFGKNPAKWKEWWLQNKTKSREEWLEDQVEKLEKKIALLEEANKSLQDEVAQKTIALLDSLPADSDPKPFIDAMKSSYPQVRAHSVKKLAEIKTEESVETLIGALSDEELEIRLAATNGLGKLGDKKALKPLSERLADKEPAVRSAAALALGSLGVPEVAAPLLSALKDTDGDVRSTAAQQLGQIGDKRAVLPLIDLLSDEIPKVRESAAAALGKLKDLRAVQPLINSLKDKDERVRFFAADSLGQIRSEDAVGSLVKLLSDSNPQVRAAAANALGKIGSELAIDSLASALKDKEETVATESANALVNIAGDDPRKLVKVGEILYESGDFKRSVEVFQKIVSMGRENQTEDLWNIKRKLSHSHLQLKEWDKALPLLNDLCAHYPDDVELKIALGQCQLEMKDYDSALSLYADCLNKFPEQSDQWWQGRIKIVNAYFKEKRYEDVIRTIDDFQKSEPNLGGEQIRSQMLKLRSEAVSHIKSKANQMKK